MRREPIFLFCLCLTARLFSQSVQVVEAPDATAALRFFLPEYAYEVANVAWTGQNAQFAGFISSDENLGHPRGLLLSTGHVGEAETGPNVVADAGFSWGDTTVLEGEQGLSSRRLWFDAVALEFDFVPLVSDFPLRAVFGSEEYCRFSERGFDDFAAVYLSGPGIDGAPNLLEVEAGKTLSVATVNAHRHDEFYQNNPPPSYTDCGDFDPDLYETTGLNGLAELPLEPFSLDVDSTYHMKIVLADAGDGLFDSALFISNSVFGPPVRDEMCLPATNFYVFPSLADDAVKVFVAGSTSPSVQPQLQVYDCTGRLLLHTSLPSSVYSVDVSGYASGFYIFKVVSGNQEKSCPVIKI